MTLAKILIVEDEALIAMLLEEYVEGFGCQVVGIGTNVQQALKCAEELDFDIALLDVNLGGQKAPALPSILVRRGKRFAFVTGCGRAGVLASHSQAPIVGKPFTEQTIADVLIRLGVPIRGPRLPDLAAA
jgi:CheY-like chemotaxis protein